MAVASERAAPEQCYVLPEVRAHIGRNVTVGTALVFFRFDLLCHYDLLVSNSSSPRPKGPGATVRLVRHYLQMMFRFHCMSAAFFRVFCERFML